MTQNRLDLTALTPTSFDGLRRLSTEIETDARESNVDSKLIELVRLRVSQLNGCQFCLSLHTKKALEGGESERRLDELANWPSSTLFTDDERAALRLAESITRLSEAAVPDEDYAMAEKYFDVGQLAGLVWIIALINTYNRLASAM